MYLPNAFNVMYLPCNCSIVMYVHFQEFLLAMELHYNDVQTLTKNFTYHAIAVSIVIYRRYHHAIAILIVWHFRFKRYYLTYLCLHLWYSHHCWPYLGEPYLSIVFTCSSLLHRTGDWYRFLQKSPSITVDKYN